MGLFSWKKSAKNEAPVVDEKPASLPIAADNEDSEEAAIVAAISVALRLYTSKGRELEETVITIQKIIKPYSPWNSKIYNLKQMPFRTPRKMLK